MGEVKLNWIQCGYNSCRNCKNKCREYLDANNSNYFEGYKPNYYFDTDKEVIADGKEFGRQTYRL